MAAAQNPALAETIAGALAWWHDAGVESAFSDDPVEWLAAPPTASEPPQQEAKAAGSKPPANDRAAPEVERLDLTSMPSSLDAFVGWWLNEPMLAEGSTDLRVAPRGSIGAELMVVVPEPERDDSDSLLSGPQGSLLAAMLSAFGLDEERVYFASALPRHLPGADWQAIAASGMGEVLTKHVDLAAPKRLCVFGAGILPLVSHDPPHGAADLRIFNHESMNVPMLACRSLAALLEQPRWKAKVWQKWLELTG